jgi:hypothetical protein
MSSPHPSTQTASDPLNQDAQHYRAVLNGLIDIGADMARLLHQQAKTQAEAAPPDADDTRPALAELAIAFDRVALAVRRSIVLARKLAEPVPVADPARPRIAARQRIIRAVEDEIQRGTTGREAATLHAELLDRLDAPDLDDDVADRPVAEIIADICRDLGLAALPGTHPWKRRTPADLATLHARAAKPRVTSGAFAHPSRTSNDPARDPAEIWATRTDDITRCRSP